MQSEELYRPCTNGIHICGKDRDEIEPVTVANFPMNSSRARRLFKQLAADFGDTDGDMVVDLMIGGDIEDDFWLRRQMFDRFSQALTVASEAAHV
ncbi:hypothetical protein [Microvirga tunisiensis]|uniref:Uncharacterized protein n=1 Tax=Microvirga tunisiensis TaxID=2108360 RepID=A0A5N7MIM8_9HYPH|nr:hypothetical protein [Microvirga tunisiensis]MPR08667.1 hypothetical protein [Microvirga tunisiensis]MPR26942.1 hypothetical protein [Microvirga tunisiensis]